MENNKFIASIEMSEQITHDEWRVKVYSLEVTIHTNIGQILDWIKSKGGNENTKLVINKLEQL